MPARRAAAVATTWCGLPGHMPRGLHLRSRGAFWGHVCAVDQRARLRLQWLRVSARRAVTSTLAAAVAAAVAAAPIFATDAASALAASPIFATDAASALAASAFRASCCELPGDMLRRRIHGSATRLR